MTPLSSSSRPRRLRRYQGLSRCRFAWVLHSSTDAIARCGVQTAGSDHEVIVGPDDRHGADDRQEPARRVEFAIGGPEDQTPHNAADNRSADAERNRKPKSQRHGTWKEKAREEADDQ